jgi:hypothetical protein
MYILYETGHGERDPVTSRPILSFDAKTKTPGFDVLRKAMSVIVNTE